jgi:two-component system chemotaxis response regulator CheB/chemosensory pili system protein ChpB (putative protein-glutamate methylesterase)
VRDSTITDMRVALLYQTSHLGGHLKDALKEFGANVVYEAPPADIDRDKLEGSGARVVIVNLDADSDSYIDQLYDVLDAGDYEVVFNDASVSSNLQGWDHARWARNLAAKILNKPEAATPPRPPGAEAVPTPVQKSASFVPVAEKPGEPGPQRASAPKPSAAPTAAPAKPARVEPPTLELPTLGAASLADAPTQEFPTVEVPRPDLSAGGLDLDDLAEFAKLAEPPPAPVEAAAPRPAKAAVESDFAAELDALFASDGDAPSTDFDISLPDEPAPKKPAAPSNPLELESIELTDIEMTSTNDAFEESVEMQSDFPAIFDQLDGAAADIPTAVDNTFKPAEQAKPAKKDSVLPPEWNLETDELPPPTGKANFGIEKVAPEDYLAPKVEETAKKVPAIAESLGGLTLELMPIEEAVAVQTYQNPNYQSESWLDGSRPAAKLKVGTGSGVQRVFVLGASIGGPEAVRDFLGALPAGFPVLFVLAQHMGEEFLELMSAQLAKSIALTVRNPTHGERVSHGDVVIVPTTHRVQIDGEGVLTMAHLPEKTQYTPSIDQVLRDVADAFGDKAGAIVFSGMAHDAIEGSKYLKTKGGTIWVQDPDTCVISSMVDGAREAGIVSFMGSPAQLAQKMIAEYGKG